MMSSFIQDGDRIDMGDGGAIEHSREAVRMDHQVEARQVAEEFFMGVDT